MHELIGAARTLRRFQLAIVYMTNPLNGTCPSALDGYPSGMAKAKKPGKRPESLGARKKPVPFRDVVQKLLETGPQGGALRRTRKKGAA